MERALRIGVCVVQIAAASRGAAGPVENAGGLRVLSVREASVVQAARRLEDHVGKIYVSVLVAVVEDVLAGEDGERSSFLCDENCSQCPAMGYSAQGAALGSRNLIGSGQGEAIFRVN